MSSASTGTDSSSSSSSSGGSHQSASQVEALRLLTLATLADKMREEATISFHELQFGRTLGSGAFAAHLIILRVDLRSSREHAVHVERGSMCRLIRECHLWAVRGSEQGLSTCLV